MRRAVPITVWVICFLIGLPSHGQKGPTKLSEWLPGKHLDDVVQALGDPSGYSDSVLIYELDPNVFNSSVGRSKELQFVGDDGRSTSRIEVYFDNTGRVSTWKVDYTGPYLPDFTVRMDFELQ
jgi:hypothetical protein